MPIIFYSNSAEGECMCVGGGEGDWVRRRGVGYQLVFNW